MPDGAWNDDLELLVLDQLHNNQTLIDAFRANPANALAPYTLTSHEHRALVTRASGDFVALGLVDSVNELPEVLRGGRRPGGIPGLPDWLRKRIEEALKRVPRPPDRLPRPRIPRPRPFPGPPDPPRPGPGPDPPGPDPRANRPRPPRR